MLAGCACSLKWSWGGKRVRGLGVREWPWGVVGALTYQCPAAICPSLSLSWPCHASAASAEPHHQIRSYLLPLPLPPACHSHRAHECLVTDPVHSTADASLLCLPSSSSLHFLSDTITLRSRVFFFSHLVKTKDPSLLTSSSLS